MNYEYEKICKDPSLNPNTLSDVYKKCEDAFPKRRRSMWAI
jgi:hypothetical protein